MSGVRHTSEIDPRLADWAAGRGLTVELPNREDVAGEFSFDTMLRDLSNHADRITARVTAKSIEYPTDQLSLAGPAWPWRPTMLSAATLALAIGVGCSRDRRQPPIDSGAGSLQKSCQPHRGSRLGTT